METIYIKIFVTILGVLMSLGYYPQAYKIWQTKSAEDISIPTYIIFSFGTFVWTLYGIYVKDPVIIFSFGVGVIGSWLVLVLTLLNRKISKI